MHRQVSMIVFTVAVLLGNGGAEGRTWRIEKDGSGDYTTIQEGIDAAAPGDTVLIGPGRFIETHEVETQGWTEAVYAEVARDSISLIGSGVDVTYIGPAGRRKQYDPRPKGIYGANGIDGCSINNMTIENIRDGIYWNGGVRLTGCSITGSVDAIKVYPGGSEIVVEDVLIQDNSEEGIIAWGPCPEFLVYGCTFNRNLVGISVVGIDSMLVAGCSFEEHVVSIQYDNTHGEIRDCNFVSGVNVDVVSYGSHLMLNNCRFSTAARAIHAATWGFVRGGGNVIPAGIGERIYSSNTEFCFNGNHIIRGAAPYIKLVAFTSPPITTLDFTGNYWGTSDADTISEWIWDGNDDPDIHAIVEFDPFSPVPLPDEKKSLGDVKRMFR